MAIPHKESGQQNYLPLVSIGMPVYNGEKYIRDALDTLLAQTFESFEIIISDNASTDNTEEICREYVQRDERIIYFRQRENVGAAKNFQFVLEHAKAGHFMWAAYDDTWANNYLMDAFALLCDQSIDFVFPSFEVRSIKLNIGKKFSSDIFEFISLKDRKQRVLQFLALHHDSHKCNIVYSLFRTKFIKKALNIQDIGNDGALGATIVALGRGRLLSGGLFRKRYPRLWPGALSFIFAWFYRNHSIDFDLAKAVALNRLGALFPEYMDEIKRIFELYRPYTHKKYYQICSIDHDFARRKSNEPH